MCARFWDLKRFVRIAGRREGGMNLGFPLLLTTRWICHRECGETRSGFASIPTEREARRESVVFTPPKAGLADHSKCRPGSDCSADWREQNKEQRAAVNQFHIAAITEHFFTLRKEREARAADLPD